MQHRIIGGTRRLFRAAAAADVRASIWVVTRGAQRVIDADTVSPDQSCLWGFCRAAALEYPHVWGGLADLTEGSLDGWSQLISQIAPMRDSAAREDQVALRDQAVYVARLVRRAEQPNATPLVLRGDATYLVTGGLGSVGLEIAGYLAAHGARHLVLTSRRSPSDVAQRRIDAVGEQYGCEFRVAAADVANPHDVARLMATVQGELPPLAGIVHAAGENSTTPLSALDDAEVERVFAGKVWGAWYVSEAAANMQLDFFISTSSISSVWGSFGQTAYSAANAFLDGLAWRLREQGVPGMSVNFGPWSAGMADEDARARLEQRGVRTLSPADALAGMADVMAASAAQGVVARIDWARFLPLYQQAGRRSFLAELEREVPEAVSALTTAGHSGTTRLVEQLTLAPVQQRKKLVVEHLRDIVADVTRSDRAEIREDAGFFDLGMDSLMAVELRRRIEHAVGREVPATLAMDHPRLTDVADYLLGDVLALNERAAEKSPAKPAAITTTQPDEQIAIVAVACRFPGAPDPDAFWEVLSGGVDAIGEVPEDRFDIDEFYDPDPETPGKIYSRYGGFLDGIGGFDPEFVGISPREAVWMDPQQRLMLEMAWEGLERAGYSPGSLRGSRTGIFVGVAANEYSHLLSTDSVDTIAAHFITGNALNAISGRVAFALGLEGPAVAVDTACSSSLVAVHQACQALRSSDCDLALAGGVNVLLSPVSIIAASRARMLSPGGRCRTFDAGADGYVRSEGCGILVLKRLSDAVREGDQICAVIAASAVNQDGASSGLTVPNGGAQQRLLSSALNRAGLTARDVDYLEAHGTGTALGDPIEVQAAGAIYGDGRDADRPLLIGSVKTNIGHLESAAGVAGLIKVVLSLQHQTLPQNLHFDEPSPHIPWDSLKVRVVDEAIPWQTNGHPRRAGVSSFGFTGTNAHVLIEEAPAQPEIADKPDSVVAAEGGARDEQVTVLPLSARSPEALVALAQRYGTWLESNPEVDIADVCFTAGAGRSHFEHRAALVVDSVRGAVDGMADLAGGKQRPGVIRSECADRPTTAWLFTGQGSQYAGMARELFDAEPVFAETVKRCADTIDEMLPRPLLEVLFATGREAGAETGKALRHTSFAQPALFAVEVGLARLWQSWGIEPDVVLGHSVGQYAAACVAGVFSLEDGARLIAERGRLFGSLPDGGRMVAVFADANRVERVTDEFPRVSIAAYNGPNTVLSGPGADLEQIVAVFTDDAIRCTWLETSHAFHSELLEPVLGEFESYAAKLQFAMPTLPLVCNRTGAVITAEAPLNAQYWRRHSRQPVQFTESIQTVAALGCSVLMEIGPQPILTGAAVQAWPEHLAAPRAIVSLRKGVDDRRQIAETLAAAYVSGHRPEFTALHRQCRRRVELPTYPFQRRQFWPKTSSFAIDGATAPGILGSAKDLASGDTVYTSRLSVKSQPWLADHVIYGTVVVPGATYAAMALAAAEAPARVQEVFFYEPIILNDKSSREVQLTLHPLEDGGGWTFQVHSRPYGVSDAEWSLNSDGTVVSGVDDEPAPDAADAIDVAIERLSRTRPEQLFETFADMELAWGPTWSTSLKSLWIGEGEAIGDVAVGDELAQHLESEPIHPVLLDLCTGVAFPAFPALFAATQHHGALPDLFLPLRYGKVTLRERMPRRFYCRATWQASGVENETLVFNLDFVDRDGRHLGGIREFTVKRAPREALLRGLGGDATRLLYTLGWHEVAPPASRDDSAEGPNTWLIAGFDELAADLPGSFSVERTTEPEHWKQTIAQIQKSRAPITGIVWRSTGPSAQESSAEATARLETEIADLLSAVHTVQADEAVELPGGLWIITERAVATESGEPVDPVQAALWGLGRNIASEEPALRCRLIDCDGSGEAVHSLADLLGTPVEEPELALRQGKFLASRLLPWARSGHLAVPRTTDYVLAPTERGAIDNLRLTETEVPPPNSDLVQVRMEAAGLNFRDVLNVLGLYPGDPGLIGGDFAGIVTEVGSDVTGLEVGQRVMGFMSGAFASRVNVPAQLLAPAPDGLSAVEAATIPAAALTVRLAFDWAQLRPGDRVLIHAASGGVGLAAIQWAQHCGATVFATASTYKRAMLRKMGVQYIYDSRTTDFADQILTDTGGSGVDVVLNSLTNEGFVDATVRATAANGRFAEIAKRDIWTPEQMASLRPDINYEIVALDGTIVTDPQRIRGLLAEVSEGLADGVWTPLHAEIYPLTEAKTAFRRMQQARHIGKIVLQMPNPLKPRADRSYLITGGLGAIGLHTASYLAQLGAGDIVLTSRRMPEADAQRVIADITERYKCRIHTFAADVGDESQVAELLAKIRAELPPLAGVAHLAGVLDDALLPEQSLERFRTTLAPKAFGACHLDRLTTNDDLDFFLVSSSVSSVLGSPGQANYATANALLDGLVAQRRSRGLPATGVNFGPWAKGGMASSQAARANLGAQGMVPLEPTAALNALGEVVAHGTGQATVINANWQRAAKMLGGSRPPILDHVLPSDVAETTGDSELLRQLQDVPEAQRADFLTEFLQREVQQFLRLAQPPVATSRFLDLGTDSLMAVELRNRLFGQFGGALTITATAVFDYPTIRSLAEYLADQLPEAGEEGQGRGTEP
jgi:acyl transferase domain-containing protein